MPFCPQCRAEYRRGFTHCSDCDTDLVAQLPTGNSPRPDEGYRAIWRGVDQSDCVSVCYRLRDLGIAYKVSEKPVRLVRRMGVSKRYELFVPDVDHERAKS